jgi:hypothetical protein
MNLPGVRLLELSARLLDPLSISSLIEPTIADLQHEVQLAEGSWWRPGLAYLRTSAALFRLLTSHGLIWRSPMRGVLAVVGLAVVGAVSLVAAFATHWPYRDSGVYVVFLAMAILSPLVIRSADNDGSYLQMFARCSVIGLTMGTSLFAWISLMEATSRLPWYGYLWRYMSLSACILLVSGLASAAAWKPAGRGDSVWRRRLLVVLQGTLTFALCEVVLAFGVRLIRGSSQSGIDIARILFGITTVSLFFAVVAFVIYLPTLSAVRRVVPKWNQQRPLTLIGATLFPIPFFAWAYLTGRFAQTASYYLSHPASAVLAAIPYVLAGAILGWLLAGRLQMKAATAP